MDSAFPTLALSFIYITFVLVGPSMMKNRPAFDLKKFVIAYNLSMVALSVYMLFELANAAYQLEMPLKCIPTTFSTEKYAVRMASAIWWYYFSKLLEFTDTVLMVVRKRNNQITFLHVYHHTSMFLIWWVGTKWGATGHLYFGPMVNCFIHSIMYFYYAVSAAGVRVPWKSAITQLQFVQFFATIIHAISGIYYDCGTPYWMLLLLTSYMSTLVALFSNFYYQTYIRSSKPHPAVEAAKTK